MQMYDDHPEYLGQTAKKSKKAALARNCVFPKIALRNPRTKEDSLNHIRGPTII